MATIDINRVTLEYVCNNDDEHEGADDQVIAYQLLADIVDSGTLICPECGDDMELVSADAEGLHFPAYAAGA